MSNKKHQIERNFLKQERKRRNLTQKQVSRYLNVHVATYANIERGTRHPGFSLAVKIADFFGVDVRKLL